MQISITDRRIGECRSEIVSPDGPATLRAMPSGFEFLLVLVFGNQCSVCHGVDHEVRAYSERFSGRTQGIVWRTDPIPEVFKVVVETGNERKRPILAVEAVKHRFAARDVIRKDG